MSIHKIADSSKECFDVAFNFMTSHLIGKAPLKVTQRLTLNHRKDNSNTINKSSYSSCLNLLANAYGYMPLQYTLARSDPVLFKDNVSIHRKKFRKMENVK